MADLDNVRLQLSDIETRQSSTRQTPMTSFKDRLMAGLFTGARVVSNVANSAGYAIPGAAVVGAAITGMGTVSDVSGGLTSNDTQTAGLAGTGALGGGGMTSGLGTSSAPGGGYLAAVSGRAAGGDASSQMMMATAQMQEMNQAFNLQYLQLQQKMQSESRDFTAMSNIMKTKHDTARNALSNLK